MAFIGEDNHIYDELRDVLALAAVTKGQAAVIQDVFGFYLNAITATDIANSRNEVTFIYRMRQVLADKATGTGEAILAGDRLYYYLTLDTVSPTATGTAGTDYYFCGWAKRNAAATATTVLMNFDGTRYDEAV